MFNVRMLKQENNKIKKLYEEYQKISLDYIINCLEELIDMYSSEGKFKYETYMLPMNYYNDIKIYFEKEGYKVSVDHNEKVIIDWSLNNNYYKGE